MRPKNLKTKIFLDSCDPAETKEILSVLGFLDGQTTNPTLVAKNPYAKERFARGDKFTKEDYEVYPKKDGKILVQALKGFQTGLMFHILINFSVNFFFN